MFGLKPQSHLTLLLLLIVVFSCSVVESLRFDLKSGIKPKCIAQDIKKNSMTVGNYTIVNLNEGHPLPDSHTITVRVNSPSSQVHLAEHVQSGQFAFVAEDSGDHIACFWGSEQIDLSIDFEWRTGIAARDWSNVAKKRKLDQTQLQLQILHETALSIYEEMSYLRERDEEMQVLNAVTKLGMLCLSFLSIFVFFSVAGFQLWHLKTFFEKKKLI